jgi:hypothetical protein
MSMTIFGVVENIESCVLSNGEPAIPSIPGTTCLKILVIKEAVH